MVNASQWLGRRRRTAIVAVATAAAVVAGGLASDATGSRQQPRIAYMSFAVANSYDAPMLKAARDVAKQRGARVNVFDAANDPKKQLAQLQTVSSSGQYDGIVLQPIFGPQLIPTVKQAIKRGIKVANIDQILGSNPATARPPVAGLSGNVVFIQTAIGRKQGLLVRAACRANKLNPCNVGFLYSVKALLDSTPRSGRASTPSSSRCRRSRSLPRARPSTSTRCALKAAQTMLQARSRHQPHRRRRSGRHGRGDRGARRGRKVVLVGYGGGEVGLKAVRQVAGTAPSCSARPRRDALACSASSPP